MKIHVDVIPEDYEKGLRGDTNNCAFHRAIERLGIINERFGVFNTVYTYGKTPFTSEMTFKTLGTLPSEAQALLERWDRTGVGTPISFDMELDYPDINLR